MSSAFSDGDDWLSHKTLTCVGLTLEDIKKCSKIQQIGKRVCYNNEALGEKEKDLENLLHQFEDYSALFQNGSSKLFGHIRGCNVVIIMESSDEAFCLSNDNKCFSSIYKEGMLQLLHDQLVRKSNVHFISTGGMKCCLSELLDFKEDKYLSTARSEDFIEALSPHGHSNLLPGLKQAFKLKQIDTICVVMVTRPKEDLGITKDYLLQAMVGHSKPKFHFVSFGSDEAPRSFMKEIVKELGGYYHHNSMDTEGSFQDTCFDQISAEMHKIRSTLQEVCLLKAKYSSSTVHVNSAATQDLTEMSVSEKFQFLDEPLTLCLPDTKKLSFENVSASEWVAKFGVVAKGLLFYKLLSTDSYCIEGRYIPITKGNIQSHWYDGMMEIEWEGGTRRRIHVDLPKIEDYMERIEGCVDAVHTRMKELVCNTKSIFGVVTEPCVILVVDLSADVSKYLLELQRYFKALLEEQFTATGPVNFFNIVIFGSSCQMWSTHLVPCNERTLQEAWKWIIHWLCQGTRNLAAAVRCLTEMLEESSTNTGVYIICSGLPDQDEAIISDFLCHSLTGPKVSLHTVFLEVETSFYDISDVNDFVSCRFGSSTDIAKYFNTVASSCGGSFHHWGPTGVIRSSEMKILEEELALCLEQKALAEEVVEKFAQHCREQSEGRKHLSTEEKYPTSSPMNKSLPAEPRHTRTSIDRINLVKYGVLPSKEISSVPVRQDCAVSGEQAWKLKATATLPDINTESHTPSEEWLSVYSLSALRIDYKKIQTSKRSKKVLHQNNKGGSVLLSVDRNELYLFKAKLSLLVEAYKKRLNFLKNGSLKYFGCVTGNKVVLLVDTSYSMIHCSDVIKTAICQLVTEQFVSRGISYNIISFGYKLTMFKENCSISRDVESLRRWLDGLVWKGNTRLTECIEKALLQSPEKVCLLTDGVQDHSDEYFFKWIQDRKIMVPIDTVGFHCTNKEKVFLKTLASHTNGRFHYYCGNENFSGDDMELVNSELEIAAKWLSEVKFIF